MQYDLDLDGEHIGGISAATEAGLVGLGKGGASAGVRLGLPSLFRGSFYLAGRQIRITRFLPAQK